MKKELSESYKKRKNSIIANNEKYKQLNFRLTEEEYNIFKDKAKELDLTDIDLFRMVMIVVKGLKKSKK